ncbi:36.4 kDa proline-rich protein [Linum perenne]
MLFMISMHLMLISLPPIHACVPCTHPNPPPSHSPPSGHRPTLPHPPRHGRGGGGKGKGKGGGGGKGHDHHPPSKGTPILLPPIIVNPPPVNPPPITYPPPVTPPVINPPPPVVTPPPPCPPGGGADVPTPPATQPTCTIGGLKLGACVDVLGGLVHVGVGNPVENVCCPVIKGLLELEAALCLCTSIRLKLLNINIFIPLALQALITCGKTPPPGFVCPPL